MKKPWLLFAGVLTAGVLSTNGLKAQDEVSKSNFSVGVDVYTSYIFRGTKFGTGPSLQPSYVFGHASVLLGAGDGWHTSDGKFAVCNIGIGTTKVIKITDTYNIPVNGQVILNPQREQLYVVVGFSL